MEEEEEEDGDDDDGDDADESGGIELGAEERKEMIMNLREEQTGSILDHRRQRANWWGIGSRSMWPPRLFRDGAQCRRTRLVQPQRRTNCLRAASAGPATTHQGRLNNCSWFVLM